METDHQLLINHCVQVLDSFDPATKAQEQHVNKYLKYEPVSDGNNFLTFTMLIYYVMGLLPL